MGKMTKVRIILVTALLILIFGTDRASAQWTVIDPSNIAQSIVNSSKSLVQEATSPATTSTTSRRC